MTATASIENHPAVRPRLARTRTVTLMVVYALLSLWALAMSGMGIVALLTGLPDDSLRFLAVGASSFKVLTVGGAVAVLLTRGRSVLAVRALVAGQVAWFVADLLAPQGDDGVVGALVRFPLSLAIWVGPWLLLATDRRRLWRAPVEVRRPVVALAALGAVPLVAWSVAASQVVLPASLGADLARELRFDASGLPLALLGAVVLCALHRVRWWDVLVGVVLTVLGVLAALVPAGPVSPGYAGLLLLLVPAVLLASRRLGRSDP